MIDGSVVTRVDRELALVCGFLLALCLIFGAIAWVAMNYLEDDLDGFTRYVDRQGA